LDVVKFLTPKLIDINTADSSGNTPLHYAAAYGWSNIVEYLIKNGAELNKKNLWNSSPASIAMQKGHFLALDIFI
jgi:ankyrin repeat protein